VDAAQHDHAHPAEEPPHAPAHAAPAHDAHEVPAHDAQEAPAKDTLARNIGITMAIAGVILAFASALGGSTRTELIATMVAQTDAARQFETISTKHRVLQAELRQMHARLPDPKVFAAAEAELLALEREAQAATATAGAVEYVRLASRRILGGVTPGQADIDRFAWLVIKFGDQREAAAEWRDSFDETIEAYRRGGEHFEWGQLLAEVAIVLCSMSMLLRSRPMWILAVVLGAAAFAIVAWTSVDVNGRLHRAQRKNDDASRRLTAMSSEKADEEADEALLREIEAFAK
jgi:hypothetical protein